MEWNRIYIMILSIILATNVLAQWHPPGATSGSSLWRKAEALREAIFASFAVAAQPFVLLVSVRGEAARGRRTRLLFPFLWNGFALLPHSSRIP